MGKKEKNKKMNRSLGRDEVLIAEAYNILEHLKNKGYNVIQIYCILSGVTQALKTYLEHTESSQFKHSTGEILEAKYTK